MGTENYNVENELELWWLMHQTTHLMERAREKEMKKVSLSVVQAGILFAIQVLGNRATPAELARWHSREPHTISGVLNGMVSKGLVEKIKDLDRRNLVRVAITDKGKEIYNEYVVKRGSIHDMISTLTEEEQQTLWSFLSRMRAKALNRLGAEQEPPAPPFK